MQSVFLEKRINIGNIGIRKYFKIVKWGIAKRDIPVNVHNCAVDISASWVGIQALDRVQQWVCIR